MSSPKKALALAVVLFSSILGLAGPAPAQDGSVRFLSAGPVRLGDAHIAHMRVFLPAVQRPIHVHFLGGGGELLITVPIEPPGPAAGPMFEVFFDATFEAVAGGQRQGVLTLSDSSGNPIFQHPSDGVIAMVVRTRNGGMGTLQVSNRDGQPVFLLPYIEQDELFRR
jgi:hypothetical protein